MSIQTELDVLRKAQPRCRMTVFGDLASRLILRSSTSEPCPREILNALGNSISSSATLIDSAPVPEASKSVTYGQSFAVFTPHDTIVCARADGKRDDVVGALLEPAQDIDAWMDATMQCASGLKEAEG